MSLAENLSPDFVKELLESFETISNALQNMTRAGFDDSSRFRVRAEYVDDGYIRVRDASASIDILEMLREFSWTFYNLAESNKLLNDLVGAVGGALSGKFTEFEDQSVGAGEWLNVLQYTGAGQVDEFFIRSPNTNFRVQIIIDGVVALDKTYDELMEVQQNSRDLSAFDELDENGDPTGYYVASMRNIPYAVSIQIKVQNTGTDPVTLPNVFVKYKTLGE